MITNKYLITCMAVCLAVCLSAEAMSPKENEIPEVVVIEPLTVLKLSGYTMSPSNSRHNKKILALKEGTATEQSEQAVAQGLVWLANHQMNDGGWSFDHTKAPKCQGKCGNPGSYAKARRGATAMALLPFLGSGLSHKEGAYKDTVRNGLYFLCTRIKQDSEKETGSFYEEEGTMYSHGLAALCLAEAYGMTKDKGLLMPAQTAVNYLVSAQDAETGGWRYQPERKCDISVTGLQMMALKGAYMAYLRFPNETPKNAMAFLDSVQAHGGAYYGYDEPGEDATCTAIGLLYRMYYGWKRDNPALEKGVAWLSERGPAEDDVYYNYYASQVMYHYGGEDWRKWNTVLRDRLVETQVADKNSHEYGSWFHASEKPGVKEGGRLYETALSVLTLEVYYRYSPIFPPEPEAVRLE